MNTPEPNPKLVGAKERIARTRAARGEGTGLPDPVGDRLPVGQHLVSGFPVLDLGIQPAVTTEAWQLEIAGAAEAKTLRWEDFQALPATKVTTDFHCVTTWSIYDSEVEGVLFTELLEQLTIDEAVTHVMLHGSDGYTTNVPLEALLRADSLVIHSWGGAPLTREHGGPVRAWIPRLYGWKSAKWLSGIEFLIGNRRGFWEQRGYHNDADPWLDQRFG